jgi:ATP-dependent DNA ligase
VASGWLRAGGEIVALEQAGRPVFADLMFVRRLPIFVAFDAPTHRGEDLRPLPLSRRKTVLKRLAS